jgi:hypothetical protein
MLRQLAVSGEDRDLRHPFVEIDAHVYHSRGLLSECFGGLSEFPAYSRLGGRPTHLWHHYGVTDFSSSPTPFCSVDLRA